MAEDRYPDQLRYHREHGWALVADDQATLGISWFAQDALGEVVFFDPPALGTAIIAGSSYGEVESLKAVSELIAPLSGEVTAINQEVVADAGLINAEPYGEGWLLKIQLADRGEVERLLGADAYEATL